MIAKPSSLNKENTFFKIFLKEFPSLLIFIRILPYYVYIVLRTTKHVHFVYFFHNSIFDYLTVNNNEQERMNKHLRKIISKFCQKNLTTGKRKETFFFLRFFDSDLFFN